MTGEEHRKKLELAILKIIDEKLERGEMSAERAREIARLVLDKIHPPLTLEQIYTIAPTLDDEFQELSPAVLPIIKEQDENMQSIVLQNAQNLLKSNKVDEALSVLKEQNKSQ